MTDLSKLSPAQKAELLARIGSRLTRKRVPATVIPRLGDADRAPLSLLQEQLWFLDQLTPGQSAYNIPCVFRLRGGLDLGALRAALGAIVDRHDVLRARFRADDGVVWQYIGPAGGEHHLAVQDVRDIADAGRREQEAMEHVEREAARPFDLTAGPLLRSLVVRLAEDDHILVVTMHHIASDGWSTAVFSAELSEFYAAHASGRPPAPSELAVRYTDYAAWQRSHLADDALKEHLDFWERKLEGLPTLEFPADRPRPAMLSYRSRSTARELPPDLLKALRVLAGDHDATLFMVLMTAYQAVLARWTGQREIVVGTTTTGRDPRELEPLIGHFVNMVVLRTDAAGDPTFAELLGRVRATVLEAWRHQQVPFERVVDRVAPRRDPSRNPLFQLGLQLLGSATQGTEPDLPGLAVEVLDVAPGGHPFDLSVTATEGPDRLRLVADYSVDLFDEARMALLLSHLERVLAAAARDPALRLSELPLLSAAELEDVLVSWQGPVAERITRPVHAQIAALAAEQPELVAAMLGDQRLSYGELERRAGALALRLRELGTVKDGVTALFLERGFDVIIGMVAAQKAGGGFVVMDPGHPSRRLAFILGDASARVVVTRSELLDRLPERNPEDGGPGWTAICLDREWDEILTAGEGRDLPELADEHTLAYVLYTSGSTGTPKGVMIEHHALNTFLLWLGNLFSFGPGDRLLQHMALIFDFAEGEIFTALTRGVTMVMVPEASRTDPEALGALIAAADVTYIGGPPAILGRIPQGSYPSLKYMIAGGEALAGDVVTRWNVPGRMFVNGYGPTEAAVGCIAYVCEHRTWTGQPPIGRPMPNRVAYVLDRWDRPLPVGVPGEIVVGGDGLARGYLNRPELTEQKFIPNPFRPGERMYRTGDLGMWTRDGQIQFLGRIDTQVKLNGLRIELEEIESTLAAHPAVAECAVVLRDDGTGGRRLVGYIVPDGDSPTDDELRAHLLEYLPPYMVPFAFVVLGSLPLTSVGKVDRTALPAPDAAVAVFQAPSTPAQEKIAEIFAAVLGTDRVGADDGFFDLGGNSLQAARVISRVAELGTSITMRDFYTAPRVSDLAALVEQEGLVESADADPVRAALVREIEELERQLERKRATLAGGACAATRPERDPGVHLPLSPFQQQLWFLEQLAPGQATYHIPVPLRLTGPLDPDALHEALCNVVGRHEALRSVFGVEDDRPYQTISADARIPMPVVDLAADEAAPRAALDAALMEDACTPFDLTAQPSVRARLLRLGPQEHVLSVVLHHINADGWSVGVFIRDLAAYYDAQRHGGAADLPRLTIQYPDHAAALQDEADSAQRTAHLDYWQRQLAGVAAFELPTDRTRPSTASNRGALLVYRIPADVARAVHTIAAAERVSDYAVFLTAVTTVISRYTGNTDAVIGAASAGRPRPELEDLVGFFTNMQALRTDLSGDPTFGEAVHRTMDTLMAAWEHQDAPFDQVVQRTGAARDLSRNPLFQISLDLLDGSLLDFQVPGLVAEFIDVDPGVARFDLAVNAYREPDGITVRAEYAVDLFDEARIRRLFEHVERLIEACVADRGLALSRIPLATAEQREAVLAFGRGAPVAEPSETLVRLFERSVARDPEHTAITCGGQRLTYGELDAASARLTAVLRAAGVRRGDMVPVLLERGIDNIVAMLGILRAGAAYSPLDVEAPADRLRFQLSDIDGPLVLTTTALLDHPALTGFEAVDVACAAAQGPEDTVAPEGDQQVTPEDLAYVLYTSGSSGRPKGALIEHGMVANFLRWMNEEVAVDDRARFLHCCSAVFDIAVGEIYSALSAGATLVIATGDELHDSSALSALVRDQQVSHIFTSPTVMRLIDPGDYPELAYVMLGGEVFTRDLYDAWRAPGRRLLNIWGPAETSIAATFYRIPQDRAPATLPIGHAMPGRRLYVLDETGPVPVGVPGEIVLGGLGVARGYLNRPELTAERFIEDPYTPGERAYRTGDLGWWTESGELMFAGRRDDQIKLRGLRIELGEIEQVLLELPEVGNAAVAVRPGAGSQEQIVAFVAMSSGAAAGLRPDDLRRHVAEKLPPYMVPSGFVLVDALPLTGSGKIARDALIYTPATVGHSTHAPNTETERRIAALYSDLLGVERIGAHDAFFAFGGNSFQAIRLVARINEAFGVGLTIREFYASSAVSDLGALVEQRIAQRETADLDLLGQVEGMSDEEISRLLGGEA